MKSALQRAGLRALALPGTQILVRPKALIMSAGLLLLAVALAVFSVTQGSFAVPAQAIFGALFDRQLLSAQQQTIVGDIRLPRILLALLCGAMLGMAGAAMQSITRNGLADPGLIGVKEGTCVVVLSLVLFFPSVSVLWRPVAGLAGGIFVTLLVIALARDLTRPRFVLIGIGVSWLLSAAVGILMTTADVRDVQTARAADVALLGSQAATGLGVRLTRLSWLRLFAPVLLTSASVSCVGGLGFVGLMAPHMARFLMRGGQVALICASALIGALLVLLADTLGRLALAPLQIPAGIVIALVGGPFFIGLLWRRRDAL
jgi:iron complex transport system permease protein